MEKAATFKNLGKIEADYFTKSIEVNPNDHIYYSNRKTHIEGQKPQIKDRTMSLKTSTVGSGKKDYKLSESTLEIYDKNKNSLKKSIIVMKN